MCLYVLNVSFLDLDQMASSCLITNISKLRKITSITLGGGVQSHLPKALGLLCTRATVRTSREALLLFILLLWESLPVPPREFLFAAFSFWVQFLILLPLKWQQRLPLTVYRGQCSRRSLSSGDIER